MKNNKFNDNLLKGVYHTHQFNSPSRALIKIKYFFLFIILSIATYASTQIVSDINKIDTTADIQTPLNTKVKTILTD